jgi:hypothetical protein
MAAKPRRPRVAAHTNNGDDTSRGPSLPPTQSNPGSQGETGTGASRDPASESPPSGGTSSSSPSSSSGGENPTGKRPDPPVTTISQPVDNRDCAQSKTAKLHLRLPNAPTTVYVQGKPVGQSSNGHMELTTPEIEPCTPYHYDITIGYPATTSYQCMCGAFGRPRRRGIFVHPCTCSQTVWRNKSVRTDFQTGTKPMPVDLI